MAFEKLPPETLLASIEEYRRLSARTKNSLYKADIGTIADLIAHTEGDLLNLTNFGRRNLEEVSMVLVRLGYDRILPGPRRQS